MYGKEQTTKSTNDITHALLHELVSSEETKKD